MQRTLLIALLTLLWVGIANATDHGPEARLLGSDNDYFADKAENGLNVVAANERVRELLHTVQIAIERYSIDYDYYPESFDELVQQGYLLPGIYVNPVSSLDGKEHNARDVPFGWSPLAAGNFTYLKQYSETNKPDQYALVGYGATAEGTEDITGDGTADGVVIVLTSGRVYDDGDFWRPAGRQEFLAHGERVTIHFQKE